MQINLSWYDTSKTDRRARRPGGVATGDTSLDAVGKIYLV
jgi:hypothetical protein